MPTRWRYTNGGGLLGHAVVIRQFYQDVWIDTDPPEPCERSNQHATNLHVIRCPEDFDGKLDHYCEVFQTLAYEGWKSLEVRDGRVYNRETDSYPCIVHGQGGHAEIAMRFWRAMQQ